MEVKKMITVEEYMSKNNIPLIAKKEGLEYYIRQWELNVYKLFSWEKYSYDDYYAIIGKRDRINDICNKCYVSQEYMYKIKIIDSDFMKQTKEVNINILNRLSSSDSDKKERWYAFRLLTSHYNDWIGYLQ